MVLGISPWVLDLGWVASIVYLSGPAPRIFMLDPIAMIGVLIATFAIGVIVAGLGMLWSFSLTASYPELLSQKITSWRIAVAAVLIAPPIVLMVMTGIR